MAMTKAEKAEMQTLKTELGMAQAMYISDPVERDVPVPAHGTGYPTYAEGWDFNTHTGKVFRAWTTTVAHGTFYERTGERSTGSQRPTPLFSTELLALRALRRSVARKAASELALLDERIAYELNKTKESHAN